MTIQQISHFIAVAQHLHFGEAAKELYIAQPALSNSIAALEGELNVKLFARSSRRVTLTPAGKVFYENVQEVVEGLNRAIQKTRLAESGYAGTLDIGILGGLSKGDFPKVIYRFQKRFPNMAINLRQTNMKTLNRWLAHGEVDLGITRSVDLQGQGRRAGVAGAVSGQFRPLLQVRRAPGSGAGSGIFQSGRGAFYHSGPGGHPQCPPPDPPALPEPGFNPNILYTAPTLEIAWHVRQGRAGNLCPALLRPAVRRGGTDGPGAGGGGCGFGRGGGLARPTDKSRNSRLFGGDGGGLLAEYQFSWQGNKTASLCVNPYRSGSILCAWYLLRKTVPFAILLEARGRGGMCLCWDLCRL